MIISFQKKKITFNQSIDGLTLPASYVDSIIQFLQGYAEKRDVQELIYIALQLLVGPQLDVRFTCYIGEIHLDEG